MALKNRNQNDTDRFRIAHSCPCCNSPCLVRSSDQQTLLSRMSYMRCTNPVCGWTGVAVTEIVRTISEPSEFVNRAKMPPMVDGVYREAIQTEMAAQDGLFREGA